MATLESLNELLNSAERILDQAAGEIRDVPLEPTHENIVRIGNILGEIFELQRQIYKFRPELIPEYLWEARERSNPTNGQIVEGAFRRAATAEEAGDIEKAIALLEFLIRTQPSGDHVERTKNEIARLRKQT